MSSFVISTYVEKLKKAWRGSISDMDLITLLYEMIAVPANLVDKSGEIISCSKTTASDIMNRKVNVHKEIKAHSQDPIVKSGIILEFNNQVVARLLVSMIEWLIQELKKEIAQSDMVESRKAELCAIAKRETLAEFLSEAYLEALLADNKLYIKTVGKNIDSPDDYKKHPLKQITPPEQITEEEQPYIYALLNAYGDAENDTEITLDLLDVYPKYLKHFKRQRDNYFAAEAVRRGIRDLYSESDPDQFQVLEKEIYDGIIDVYEDDWDNGFSRVKNVLIQASKVPVARCWLSHDTDWVGNAQKKGVCHILVNNGRIKGWRDEDV